MRGTTPHARRGRSGLCLAAAAVLVALTGCSGPGTPSEDRSPVGGGAAAGTPSAAAPPRSGPKPATSPKPVRAPVQECLVGTWRLKSTKPAAGSPVEHFAFSGRGAFDLRFSDAGRWRLTGDPDAPLTATIEIGGFPVSGTAAVDGTARGRYRLVDSVAVFRLADTSGEVDLRWATGKRTLGLDSLAGALVPDGTAALRCSAKALTVKAENVTLSLTRR